MPRARRRPSKDPHLTNRHPNAAGIDIGAKSIYVAVPPDRPEPIVRQFTTFTNDLQSLATWLKECGVDTVAMEATGVYWVPLYEVLESHGIDVHLVNAHHVRTVPGRKSDVLDCQWLQQLHSFGLLQRSFRPTADIVEFREYLRQHRTHVRDAATQVQRMQKALTLMNIQLHNILTDITGQTGMAILRGIIAGERDPKILATHRDARCKASQRLFEESLTGNYRNEHVFALRQALKLYEVHQRLAADCHDAADKVMKKIIANAPPPPRLPLTSPAKRRTKSSPPVDYRKPLYQLTGTDLTAIPGFSDHTAASLIAEIGTDMSRWSTAKHFTSWLRLTPRTMITGGKPKDRSKLPTKSRASEIFRRVAICAARTKTSIAACYRRYAAKPDRAMHAIAATAHKLARIVYALLKHGVPYQEPDLSQWAATNRKRAVASLKKRAEALGMQLVPAPT